MNKGELITNVANDTDLTKKEVEIIINSVFINIQKALMQNDKVQIIGFGSFDVKFHSARKGRNPRTGDVINIPESKIPVFKPSKILKDRINK